MSDEIHEEVRDAQRASMSYHGSQMHQRIQNGAKDVAEALSRANLHGKIDACFEQSRLREHSAMLGQIAGLVAEFCEADTTTLDGVKLMKAELYELRAEKLRQEAGWE